MAESRRVRGTASCLVHATVMAASTPTPRVEPRGTGCALTWGAYLAHGVGAPEPDTRGESLCMFGLPVATQSTGCVEAINRCVNGGGGE